MDHGRTAELEPGCGGTIFQYREPSGSTQGAQTQTDEFQSWTGVYQSWRDEFQSRRDEFQSRRDEFQSQRDEFQSRRDEFQRWREEFQRWRDEFWSGRGNSRLKSHILKTNFEGKETNLDVGGTHFRVRETKFGFGDKVLGLERRVS